ncbi:MAG: hypothetical protein Q8P41_27630 [Pseudomonadota bacterium]|nr:hypothetical protein [Pseudomonadota bacterium]
MTSATSLLRRIAADTALDESRRTLLQERMGPVVARLKRTKSLEFRVVRYFVHGSTVRGTAVASDVDDLDIIVELEPGPLQRDGQLLDARLCLKHFHRLLKLQWRGLLAARSIRTQLQSHSVGLNWEPRHRIDVVPAVRGTEPGQYLVPEIARGAGSMRIPTAWVPTFPEPFNAHMMNLAGAAPDLRDGVRLLKMWKRAIRERDATLACVSSYAIEVWCAGKCEIDSKVSVSELIAGFWDHFSRPGVGRIEGLPAVVDPWTRREIIRPPAGHGPPDPFSAFRKQCALASEAFDSALFSSASGDDGLVSAELAKLFYGRDHEKLVEMRSGRTLRSDPLLPADEEPYFTAPSAQDRKEMRRDEEYGEMHPDVWNELWRVDPELDD